MHVQVEIMLSVKPTAVHKEAMQVAAASRTNDKKSIQIFVPKELENRILAFFTINKARQMDVVDHIGKAFYIVDDYQDCTIIFPKKEPIWQQPTVPSYTAKQGQYLSFIYYYTKLNGRPPAHNDMQKYFQSTPAAVHNMVLTLEKKGLISCVPHQPRSLKLLVSRADIPDLD